MSRSTQPIIHDAIVIRQTLDWRDCAKVARIVFPRFFAAGQVSICAVWIFFVLQRMYWPQAVKFANLLPIVVTLAVIGIFISMVCGVISWNRFIGVYSRETVFCFDKEGNFYMPQSHDRKIKLSGYYKRTPLGYMLYDFEREIPAIILLRRGFANAKEFDRLEEILIKFGMGRNHVGQRTSKENSLYPDLYKQGSQRHPRR